MMYIDVLGVKVCAVNLNQAVQKMQYWIEKKEQKYVHLCTVHTIMECRKNMELLNIVNSSGMALPDGMPLVWLNHYYGYKDAGRVYGPELMLALCKHSLTMGYRHYFYGGTGDVSMRLATALKQRHPQLQIAGYYSPPVSNAEIIENMEIINDINNKNPDIIWVGLGTPKQDFWVARHRSLLNAAVLIPVGAAFDFLSGKIPQAPMWMRNNGLEWLFRLIIEPKRLAYRYCVYNTLFMLRIFLQMTCLNSYGKK
jgi:N-acetylglucosaminyldiphosphoundecaprenol N-acetyl-beta-D-mannosaminyltransferase